MPKSASQPACCERCCNAILLRQRNRAAAAEHAHAADAAARPQDRRFFEGQNQPDRVPDLAVAAQLMGNPLGGIHQPRCA